MNFLTSETVDELTLEALESIAFVLGESLDEHDHNYDRYSTIQFSGAGEESELTISATNGFLVDLACNMLGVEPDEVCLNKEGDEALRELANIICGEVVQALGGITTPFRLGLPSNVDSHPNLEDCDELVQSTIESDCGTMRISIARIQK